MGPLLPIITKSIIGNNESIITHYEPTQLADAGGNWCNACYLGYEQSLVIQGQTNFQQSVCLIFRNQFA
jgi:hypothetical protein